MEIGVSGSFASLNTVLLYNNREKAKEQYKALVVNKGKKGPDKCIKCGKCEEACPQHISIRDNLEKASKILL